MVPEARESMRRFVESQKTENGYMNAGGHEDLYYKQFGEVLEAVFNPLRLFRLKVELTVAESKEKNTVYGQFFDFLESETLFKHPKNFKLSPPQVMTTNSCCCLLAMQHQMGNEPDANWVAWLQERQDETVGFHANEVAPVPDLLSTAVALFTLRLIGAKAKDATHFIHAHWLDNGGFSPTILDDYSDVEYVFYGLLALGSK